MALCYLKDPLPQGRGFSFFRVNAFIMDTIKTSALVFIGIIICLVLLLTPDSYQGEALVSGTLPANQDLAALNQQQPTFRIERKQLAAIAHDQTVPIGQDKPIELAGDATTVDLDKWPLIWYAELAKIEELENQPSETALGELVSMLSNDDPVIRLAALESVADMSHPARLPVLTAALDDPNSLIRIAALEALGSVDSPSAVSSIEPHLFDRESEVRLAAIEALARLEYEQAIHALAGLLSDQDVRIRHHAVNAIGEIGGKYAISYLLQARYDPDETIRANAEAILDELGS